MAKGPQKTLKNPNNTLLEYKSTKKSRQQIYQENYQKNKERKKQQQKANYSQKKEQAKEKLNKYKYYGAEAIKVLLSLKEYTELNKEKHKLYADFCWTLQDCQKGINDIVFIMKLEQVAETLIKDYLDTAKKEIRKGKSWNSLDYNQQQKLVRYWGYEKARIENGYIDTAEQLERQSETYLKDIELAKFHEQRGKIKCDCYSCAEQKTRQKEAQEQILSDYDTENKEKQKIECPDCGKLRVLDEESGVCKSCVKKYE